MASKKKTNESGEGGNIALAFLAGFLAVVGVILAVMSFFYKEGDTAKYLSASAVAALILGIIATVFIQVSELGSDRKSSAIGIAYWSLVIGAIGLAVAVAALCFAFNLEVPKDEGGDVFGFITNIPGPKRFPPFAISNLPLVLA